MGATKYSDTDRLRVLGLYVEGFSPREISFYTGMAPHTVLSILACMNTRSQKNYHAATQLEPTPLQPGH